jgi:hypothetical protein
MGKLRAQFYLFGKPVMNWKGSFIVSKVRTTVQHFGIRNRERTKP